MAGSKFSTWRRNGYRIDPFLLGFFLSVSVFQLRSAWIKSSFDFSFFLSFFLFVSWLDRGAVCLRGMRRNEGGDRQEIACANLINENTIDKGFKFGPHERLV